MSVPSVCVLWGVVEDYVQGRRYSLLHFSCNDGYKAKSQHQSDETLGSVRSTFFLKTFIYYYSVCGREEQHGEKVCVCVHACAWRSENNFPELSLSFHPGF